MKDRNNLKSLFNWLKYFGNILAIWPLKNGANKTEIFIYEVKWWSSFINVNLTLIPLVIAVYVYRHDHAGMTKTLSELTALVEVIINLIQCKIESNNFQEILTEIEYFFDNANAHEVMILQKYNKRYKNFHVFMGSVFVSTGTYFILIPLMTTQLLIADGWYPFSLEPFHIHAIVYINQAISTLLTAFGLCVDLIIATMLWFSAAQIELLSIKVSKATNEAELKECARRHQQLTVFTSNLIKGIRFMIFKTNVTMLLVIICAAFQLIHHEPLEILLQFMCLTLAGLFRLYISAKPADYLKENGNALAESAFQVALEQKSPTAKKIALMLGFRCQRPFVISVSGIIKVYNLQYYASFLSSTLTYFMNLRLLLED